MLTNKRWRKGLHLSNSKAEGGGPTACGHQEGPLSPCLPTHLGPPLPLAAPRLPEGRIPSSCAWKEGGSVWGLRTYLPSPFTRPGPTPPPLARGSLLPTWLRVLCDFCIQARHWS